MEGKSTQVKSDDRNKKKCLYTKGASAKTLNLLKMFARSYQSETSLSVAQGAACLN